MNNQAAQTMPELASDDPIVQMRMVVQTARANDALISRAWVSGWADQWEAERAAAMLAAAPAASGVHPDALPDGTLSKSTAKRVTALAASGGEGPTLHPATEDLIRRFSDALREKLSAAEKKYGYSDGWASPDWMDQCRRHLDQHVAKGDPRDVAAYCAFLWHHGEPTTKRDRDADRKRFPDDDFNAWLDAGISDAGHTVYDSLSSIEDAWQGWHGHVLSVMIDENPVFDDLAIDCHPSAASVSERARELLAAECRTHGWHEDAGRLCMGGEVTSFVEDDALRVIDRLIEQGDEDNHVITELGRLLAGIAVILKGPEPAGTAWSYHDLPELVASSLSEPRQVAAEMKAWAHTKMAEQQSSRRDRMMVSEWAKRLLPESSFPIKDFDVEGMSITKEAAREAVKRVALEQALTQQRGHGEAVDRDAWAEALELPEGYTVEEFLPGGWHYAWTRADGERMVSGTTWNHPALAAIAAWKYAPATTPQPSADAVRAIGWLNSDGSSYLPNEKRARMIEAGKREGASVGEVTFGKIAEDHRIALYAAPPSVACLVTAWRDRINVDPEDPYEHGESDALMSCADELESLLSAASGEEVGMDKTVSPYPVVPMGYGLVTIGEGHINGVRALVFGNRGSGEFGTPADGNRFMEDGETICAITFATPEAVELLRSYVNEIAASFNAPDAIIQPRHQQNAAQGGGD